MEKLKPYLTINVIWPLVFAAGFLYGAIKSFLIFLRENNWSPRQLILITSIFLFFLLLAYIFFMIAVGNKKAD